MLVVHLHRFHFASSERNWDRDWNHSIAHRWMPVICCWKSRPRVLSAMLMNNIRDLIQSSPTKFSWTSVKSYLFLIPISWLPCAINRISTGSFRRNGSAKVHVTTGHTVAAHFWFDGKQRCAGSFGMYSVSIASLQWRTEYWKRVFEYGKI